MNKLIPIVIAAATLLAATPNAIADGSESRAYTTSLGASVAGIGAAGNNALFGPGAFTSDHLHTRVTVAVTDDSGTVPYVTVCVDRNNNNICTTNDGDIQSAGLGTVVVSSSSGFQRIIVYVYAAYLGQDGNVATGTTGLVRVTWS